MLTFSTGTNIKCSLHQNIGNALEISKSLKKSEFGSREGGKLITRTPVSHGQSSCTLYQFVDEVYSYELREQYLLN